ncbi:MAG: hypothetical protein SPF46_06630, partial [Blautia sp.]|nr:hypothetical protein [Blautia sp.]
KYVTNPNKTNDKLLVSCVGCTEQNAPGVFNLALMGNGQKALDEQVVKQAVLQYCPKKALS